MRPPKQMEELRKRIDEIDGKMIALFQDRMAIARQVAEIKRESNKPILDAAREQQVVDRAVSHTDEALRGEIALLMRSIMAFSRGYQRKSLFSSGEVPLLPPARPPLKGTITCAYQGVPGAWSEQALIKVFPNAGRLAVEYFEDVFLAVKQRKADYGVVAIENSRTGAIGETYDLLRKYGCFIVGRTRVDIGQCLPDAYGNSTFFVVIADEPEYDTRSDLISIIFLTAHRPGALCEALLPFMAQGINLIRIESRPSAPGEYRFFADLQGNILEASVISALNQAASACAYFEVIGCYSNTGE